MKKYDFSKSAAHYDAYYGTETGKLIDRLEKEAMGKLLAEIPPGEVLEMGCGTGHWTKFFTDKGFYVHGIDISEKMLHMAEKKSIANAEFKKTDFLKNRFADCSFAHVFSVTALEFTENQDKTFDEIYRILKPGGFFLAGCLNSESEMGQAKEQNETFAYADFFAYDALFKRLKRFGTPKIIPAVFMRNGKIIDSEINQPMKRKEEAAFFAALVQKTR